MQFPMSWKTKFRLLLALTLAGLALMAASAFWANQRLYHAFDARQEATVFQTTSVSLLADWRHMGAFSQLTPASVGEFREMLDRLRQDGLDLLEQSRELGDPELVERTAEVVALLERDIALRHEWLSHKEGLGLTPNEGQRKRLGAAAETLQAIPFGVIQPFITTVMANMANYLATLDSDYAGNAQEALSVLQSEVVRLDWQENVVGQAVSTFAAEFAGTDALIRRIAAAQVAIAQQGAAIEAGMQQQAATLQAGILSRTAEQANDASRSGSWMLLVSFVVIALVLFLIIGRVSRQLVTQLDRVIGLLSTVATGNLTERLPVGTNDRDEFNRLGSASNRMIQDIAQVIRQVLEGNHELGQLQAHLSEAMRRLEENSGQVEMQTEHAASASQQIAATINEMAQRTSEVNDATHAAFDSARAGAEVIGTSVSSMRNLSSLIQATHTQVTALSRASGKVAGIVDVINGLAGQTNLLALNAAIEAARAGEAGRGFSVVADEVRSLAQKTVSATTDISSIVAEFREQTGRMDDLMVSGLKLASEGEQHASEVAGAIDTITASMERLTSEMNQVVVAIEEISVTTEEVANKIEDINVHTSATKGLRVTLEGHAQGLARQVAALDHSASQFRIA